MSLTKEEHKTTEKTLASGVGFWLFFMFVTIMYVYATVVSVGNVTGVLEIAQALESGLSAMGILWAGFSVLMPVIVFVIAVLLGIGRSYLKRSLLMFLGLTLVSIWYINLLHFVHVSHVIEF
ncbi:MAG TPA: hypothetical protein VLZ31_08225 [Microbacteriaceae bacterium]|nr:hypothetical protein [Microbacteriaceae bacterium]